MWPAADRAQQQPAERRAERRIAAFDGVFRVPEQVRPMPTSANKQPPICQIANCYVRTHSHGICMTHQSRAQRAAKRAKNHSILEF